MATGQVRGVTIFYCYASKDEKYLRELEKHLVSLKRLGKVTTWYDRQILPGMEWKAEIEAHLDKLLKHVKAACWSPSTSSI